MVEGREFRVEGRRLRVEVEECKVQGFGKYCAAMRCSYAFPQLIAYVMPPEGST